MGRKLMNRLSVLAVTGLCLLVLTACPKKPVQVPPTSETGAMGVEQGTGGTMGGAEGEMEDAAIREARIRAMQEQEAAKNVSEKKIYFDYDRFDLSAEARATLKEIGDMMTTNPSWNLDISGHCDERGTIEYNLALGERRARSAKKYLVSLGIAADRISTISYGEERPTDARSTEEAWARNRRGEFSFITR